MKASPSLPSRRGNRGSRCSPTARVRSSKANANGAMAGSGTRTMPSSERPCLFSWRNPGSENGWGHRVGLSSIASVYIGNRWGRNPYFIRFIKDHWLSAYPVVIPIIIFPIYIPLKFIIYYYHIPYNHPLVLLLNDIMEKISASAIASISVVVLYL